MPDRRWIAPAAICVLSLIPRLPNLAAPPLDRHDFRQTQTAITVQAYLDRGASLWAYQTPVFGPPWRVPFELPMFQLSALPLARLGVPLDAACRLAALGWFYASAALLFAAAARVCGRRVALLSLAAYVAMPFTVFWSRAIVIDYASVALSLAYLHAAMIWGERRSALALAGCVAAGALAAATKITTLGAFLMPVAAVAIGAVRRASHGRDRARILAWVAVIVGVPLAAGFAWTRFADAVKAAQPATRFLTSEAVRDWVFGTLAERLKPGRWMVIGRRIGDTMFPGAFVLLLGAAGAALAARRGTSRNAVLVALAGALATVAVFFHLYVVHDYYLIALTPCGALVAGFGADAVASLQMRFRRAALAAAAGLAVLTAGSGWKYVELAYRPWRLSNLVDLAGRIAQATPRDRWVAIEGDDWNPRLLYLAHRRGFMLRPGADFAVAAASPAVSTLVCSSCPPELLAVWPERRKLSDAAGFAVYAVGAQPVATPGGFEP
jgi:4-amino-4-deoxy-L-arabinose transferase-like glycosyltransferase